MDETWRTVLYRAAPRSRTAGFESLLVTVETALESGGYPGGTLHGLFEESGRRLGKPGLTVARAVSREIGLIWEQGDRELLMRFLKKRFPKTPTAGEFLDTLLYRLSGGRAGW